MLMSIARSMLIVFGRILEKVRLRGIARFFSLVGPIVLGRGARPVECVAGFRIMADPGDYASCMMIYGRYTPEITNLLRALVKPNDRVIDVGAQIGFVTLHLSRLVGTGGHVYSIEPDPNALERLKVAVTENRLTNVSILPVAASDVSGDISFFLSPTIGWSTAASNSHFTDLTRIFVRGVPIDVMLAEGTITGPISLVKIDAEGFECSILDGMEILMNSYHPIIVMEVNPMMLKAAGRSTADLLSRITRHDYRVYSIHIPRRSLRNDQLELRTVDPGDTLPFCDVLCVPPGFTLPSAGLKYS